MLTDKYIKSLRPGYNPAIDKKTGKPRGKTDKPYKSRKEQGLHVKVYPDGKKLWQHSVIIHGRETTLSYGTYPKPVNVKLARQKAEATRHLIAKDRDPVAEKKAQREARADSFKAIAGEWLDAKCPPHKKRNGKPVIPDPDTIEQLRRRLDKYVYPRHGRMPIKDLQYRTQDLHATLKRIVAKGKIETAHRVRSVTSRVFRYAIATGRADNDPAAGLKDALPSAESTSFAAITDPNKIGPLLRAIDGYDGQPSTIAALKLAPLVFVRPFELRRAQWPEIDLEAAEWRIPAKRMKMRMDHLVPLSRQAVAILEDLQTITGHRKLVFPGIRSGDRPISENTINGALRRLGYTGDEMTGHGFRSMASTCLNELRFDPDLIEVQLAHMDEDRVRAIYNRINTDSYKAMRREMMQAWADYLDGLKSGAKVTPIRGRRERA